MLKLFIPLPKDVTSQGQLPAATVLLPVFHYRLIYCVLALAVPVN